MNRLQFLRTLIANAFGLAIAPRLLRRDGGTGQLVRMSDHASIAQPTVTVRDQFGNIIRANDGWHHYAFHATPGDPLRVWIDGERVR